MKKLTKVLIAGGLIVGAIALKPNQNLVPGSRNPNVTQENIGQTVCVAGFTGTIRPSAGYTTALKLKQMKQWGLKGTASDYEEDHYISLVLGGNPTDPQNLYPQPYPEAKHKDFVETYLAKKVCAGEITLKDAQDQVRNNWQDIYKQHINVPVFGGLTPTPPDPDDE